MEINRELLIQFVCLNIFNVIIQTIKSLCTLKCGKFMAALVNAFAYGLYTIVLVYTVCELPLMLKVIVVAIANFIGVYIVKYFEEKIKKDKLWKVEVTLPKSELQSLVEDCRKNKLTYNYIDINRCYLFNFYCPTQKESEKVKLLLKNYTVTYFVSESKVL